MRNRTRAKPGLPKSAANLVAKSNQVGYGEHMEGPPQQADRGQAFVPAGKVRATHSAKEGATALGLELSDMLAVAMALARPTSTRA